MEQVEVAIVGAAGRWTVGTRAGDTLVARHVVLASGPLHVPSYPRIPGLETFRGKVFHSARWDHGCDLTGKRVASIGTGGSAIQYCPRIAPRVDRLHVFQRTPAWVIPRDTRRYSEGAQRRYARLPWLRKLHRARLYWTNESRLLGLLHPALVRVPEAIARRHVRSQVRDPALVAVLTPSCTFGCKRVLISNDWYPMFNRPNVELVTAGIREVRERGVVTEDGAAPTTSMSGPRCSAASTNACRRRCGARCGPRAAPAGTSRRTAATSPSGRGPPRATGCARGALRPGTTISCAAPPGQRRPLRHRGISPRVRRRGPGSGTGSLRPAGGSAASGR